MPRQLRVFLCHASQDKPAVRKLYMYLKQHGIQPWLDREDLLPGQDWEVEIPKALFASDVILVCLSKHSVNKEGYVQKEIAFALDKALEKPEGTIFIIPVKLEECDVPNRLKRYQWVEYFQADGRIRLLTSLNIRAQSLSADVLPVFLEAVSRERKVGFVNTINWRRLGIATVFILLLIWGGTYLVRELPSLQTETPTIVVPSSTVTSESLSQWTATATQVKTPVSPTKTPSPDVGTIFDSNGVIMMYVPAGSFSMGSDDNNQDEKPSHAVFLDAFYIDKFEVTNKEYERCVITGVCLPPQKSSSLTHSAYFSNPEFADYPVIYVVWSMAEAYCEWRDARLPTEAEWEKAARGVDGRTYPWGEDVDCDKANYKPDEYCVGDTSRVGSYLDNVSYYGLYDMAGNVWEWVADWYDNVYYPVSPYSNPTGPESGQGRGLRGGSWYSDADNIRSAIRYSSNPMGTSFNFGFRCALSP